MRLRNGSPPQDRCAPGDQPNRGDVREYFTAGNMIAQSLDRLMGSLKVAPDQIKDPGGDRSRGVHANSGSHLFGHVFQSCVLLPFQRQMQATINTHTLV